MLLFSDKDNKINTNYFYLYYLCTDQIVKQSFKSQDRTGLSRTLL